jgi:hypothetical protein
MSMDETSTTAVTPLLALGDADAAVCADGFCAVPPAKTAPTGPEQPGADE